MIEEQLLNKDKKFKFDMHNFDEEVYVDPNQEEEPPAPTFSEEELAAAKAEAFAQGKQEGIAESKASRDQKIAELLETITTQYRPFYDAENAREKIYEIESVKLCYAAFKKLFPVYEKKHGQEELKAAISQVLARHQGQSKISITVNPDAQSAIEEHLNTISQDVEFEVSPDPELDFMSSKLKWKDGGALRHANQLADEIFAYLEEALAAQGVSVHDREEEESGAKDEQKAEESIETTEEAEPQETSEPEKQAAEETETTTEPEPETEQHNDG